MVQIAAAGPPANYRDALDTINNQIGGAAAGPVGGPWVVNGAVGNVEPLSLMDSTLGSVNLLMVDSRENADFVAGQILILTGLHAWVASAETPALFR